MGGDVALQRDMYLRYVSRENPAKFFRDTYHRDMTLFSIRVDGVEVFVPVRDAVLHGGDADETIILAGQMGVNAGPAPVLGAGDKSGPDRVEFDIATGGKQTRLVHRRGLETSLPEQAGTLGPTIEVLRVEPVGPANNPRQAQFVLRNQDQMDVIGHEAVGPALDVLCPAGFCQEGEVMSVIVIREEDLLPAVTALRHVVWGAGMDDAGGSWH